MRLATVRTNGTERLAAVSAGGYRRIDAPGGLTAVLRAGVDPRELPQGEPVEGELAAPLRPGKIVAIGLNYLDHIRESGTGRARSSRSCSRSSPRA